MRPLERPVTVTPDVTAFLSPPDPAELIEETLPDDEPYVPYIPNLPPRPVRFPGRRKLTDDIEKFQPAEFGTGVEPATESSNNPKGNLQSTVSNFSPATQDPPLPGNRPDRGVRPHRRDRSESRRERGHRGDHSASIPAGVQPAPSREVPGARPVDTQADQVPHSSEGVDEIEGTDATDSVALDPSTNEGSSGEPRRRHRRRGRRKGRGQGSGGGES